MLWVPALRGLCPASLQLGAAGPARPVYSSKAACDHPDVFHSQRRPQSVSAVSWEPQGLTSTLHPVCTARRLTVLFSSVFFVYLPFSVPGLGSRSADCWAWCGAGASPFWKRTEWPPQLRTTESCESSLGAPCGVREAPRPAGGVPVCWSLRSAPRRPHPGDRDLGPGYLVLTSY